MNLSIIYRFLITRLYEIVWYVPLRFLCMVIAESFLDKQSFEKYISIKKRNKVPIKLFNNSTYELYILKLYFSGIVSKKELAKLGSDINRVMFNKSLQIAEPQYSTFQSVKNDNKSQSFFTSPLIDDGKETPSDLDTENDEIESQATNEEKEEETPKTMLKTGIIPSTPVFLKEKLYDVVWYRTTKDNGTLFVWPALVVDPGDLDSRTLSQYRKYHDKYEKTLIPLRLFNIQRGK